MDYYPNRGSADHAFVPVPPLRCCEYGTRQAPEDPSGRQMARVSAGRGQPRTGLQNGTRRTVGGGTESARVFDEQRFEWLERGAAAETTLVAASQPSAGHTFRIAAMISSVSRFVHLGSISTPLKRPRISMVRGHDTAP